MRFFENCDLEFPKLKDARPKLPVALILNYKRSTNAKEKGEAVIREKE